MEADLVVRSGCSDDSRTSRPTYGPEEERERRRVVFILYEPISQPTIPFPPRPPRCRTGEWRVVHSRCIRPDWA